MLEIKYALYNFDRMINSMSFYLNLWNIYKTKMSVAKSETYQNIYFLLFPLYHYRFLI